MTKYRRYFGSLLRQMVVMLLIIGSLSFLGAVMGGDVDFSYFFLTIADMYSQITFNFLIYLFRPALTPELYSQYIVFGILFRIIISLLVALLSIRCKYRYAIIVEIVLILISITLLAIISIQ